MRNFQSWDVNPAPLLVEYLTAEVLELAGNASKDLKASHLRREADILSDASRSHFPPSGQAYHSPPFAARHSWRRGARHSYQGEAQSTAGQSPLPLTLLFASQATIAGGGVIPHIHKSLINKTGKDGLKVSPIV